MFTRLWDGIRFKNQSIHVMKINNNSIPLLYSHTGCSLGSGQCDYKDNEMGFVDIVLIILLVSFVSFSPFIINEVENKTNETNE